MYHRSGLSMVNDLADDSQDLLPAFWVGDDSVKKPMDCSLWLELPAFPEAFAKVSSDWRSLNI